MSAPTRPAVPVHGFDCAVCGKPIDKPTDGRLVINTHRADQAVIAAARREHERTLAFERGELPPPVNLAELLAEDDEHPVPWEPRHYGCHGSPGYEIDLERITQWWQVAAPARHPVVAALHRLAEDAPALRRAGRSGEPGMSRVVAGHCPMGCGATLILLPDTRVWCGSRTCPRPEAVSLLLADPETEHVVVLGEGSFTVQHPLRERLDGALFDCTLHQRLTESDGPPRTPGGYRVIDVGIDPVSASLHDDGLVWEPVQ